MDGNAAAANLMAEIDEAFALSLEGSGHKSVTVTCQVESVLLPEDIKEYLDEYGNLTHKRRADETDVRLLREKHHSVARLAAQGLPQAVIATMTGYSTGHLSAILRSPAMIELIEHYRAPGNLAAQHIGENLRRVAGMALEVIEEKIDQDQLSPSELTAVAKLGYDRSGHGPQSQVHNITEHHLIDHAEIMRRHQEARRRDADLIVHPEEVRKALPRPEPPSESEL